MIWGSHFRNIPFEVDLQAKFLDERSLRAQEAKKLDRLQSEANQLTAIEKKEEAEAGSGGEMT